MMPAAKDPHNLTCAASLRVLVPFYLSKLHQPTPAMTPSQPSRRSFLKATTMAGAGSILSPFMRVQAASGPLMAYVGTYSSPLHNVKPGQVDLPPGNGRGIHLFQVDRATGALTPSGVFEQSTSPSCLAFNAAGTCVYSSNETDKVDEQDSGSVDRKSVV